MPILELIKILQFKWVLKIVGCLLFINLDIYENDEDTRIGYLNYILIFKNNVTP